MGNKPGHNSQPYEQAWHGVRWWPSPYGDVDLYPGFVALSEWNRQVYQNAKKELFESVCRVCGIDWRNPLTRTERGRINAAVKELSEAGATPKEVEDRAKVYRRTYPKSALTPQALTGNWSQLEARKPSTPKSVCDQKGHVFEAWASYCVRCGKVPNPERRSVEQKGNE